MNLAVIPARGGSQRIPGKNIRHFCGKPMIAWSIEAARASGCFDRVIVSTDDEQIASVARAFGAEVPFRRPPELADDYTGTAPVIRHAVKWCIDAAARPDLVCCIYATAPFMTAGDIVRGRQSLLESGSDYAFSVTDYASPIQRALRITPAGRIEMFQPECLNTRSQDLEPAYHDAAQFYWGRTQAWLDEVPLFTTHAVPIILMRDRVQDIDNMVDWMRAQRMFRAMKLESSPDKTKMPAS